MPLFLHNVPDDWGAHYTTCENCGARYHKSEGYCCEPEPIEGRAEKLEDFDEQLSSMSDEQWEYLTKILHETKDPELVEFFETHLTHEG